MLLVGFADELRQRVACEVAILVVHRVDARPIHCQKLSGKQIKLPAKDEEFPEHLLGGRSIHTAEIGDGAEVRRKVPQQPDDLDIAVDLPSGRRLDRTRLM